MDIIHMLGWMTIATGLVIGLIFDNALYVLSIRILGMGIIAGNGISAYNNRKPRK